MDEGPELVDHSFDVRERRSLETRGEADIIQFPLNLIKRSGGSIKNSPNYGSIWHINLIAYRYFSPKMVEDVL